MQVAFACEVYLVGIEEHSHTFEFKDCFCGMEERARFLLNPFLGSLIVVDNCN